MPHQPVSVQVIDAGPNRLLAQFIVFFYSVRQGAVVRLYLYWDADSGRELKQHLCYTPCKNAKQQRCFERSHCIIHKN